MKSIRIILIGITVALVAALSSCEEFNIEVPENTPVENFQYVWEKFDSHYGMFELKNVNWNIIYNAHRPLAEDAQTNEELFTIIASMMRSLNDKHVNIYSTDPVLKDYNSGYDGHIPAQEDFLFKTVREAYLATYYELDEDFGYGKLKSGHGYIHMSAFKDNLKDFKNFMDKAINYLSSSPGIIVDIRDHTGGDDHISKYIAGRFTSDKTLFMTTRKRNGLGHDDFAETLKWFVEPEGDQQYSKKVVLLTSSHSISAAETFTLAMKQNNQVIQVGDTTAGAFSDQVFFEMPKGWFFTVSVGDFRAANGQSYEGIGIAPDIFIRNEKADVAAGVDKMLEMAMQQFN